MTTLTTELASVWFREIARTECTERTIRRWVEAGEVPNRGTKRRILVDTDDLEHALDRMLARRTMSASV